MEQGKKENKMEAKEKKKSDKRRELVIRGRKCIMHYWKLGIGQGQEEKSRKMRRMLREELVYRGPC